MKARNAGPLRLCEKDLSCAVTMSYDDLVKYDKEAGRLREEGKEYVVQDGDIKEFVSIKK